MKCLHCDKEVVGRDKQNSALKKCVCCGEFLSNGRYGDCCSYKCKTAHKKFLQAQARAQPVKLLAQWIDEARQCNLDYGTYRGLVEIGKTFEELKAIADNHLGVHHARKRKFI